MPKAKIIALSCSLALLMLALPGELSAAARSKTMPDIVARSIEHHGGRGFHESDVSYELCSKSGCSNVQVTTDDGVFMHQVESQTNNGIRRIRVDNDSVRLWLDGVDQTVAADHEQRWRDAATVKIYHVFLPSKLSDPSVRFEDLGLEAWGEQQLHRVSVGFESGTSTDAADEMVFWFDPESARLEQFAYSYHDPDGLRFRLLLNHRRVGGLLFHDQQNLGWDGPGMSIDELSADTVGRLREVSTVEVKSLEVLSVD